MHDSGSQTFFDVLPQPCQTSSSGPSSTLPVVFKTLEPILNETVLHTLNYASTDIAADILLYCHVGLVKPEQVEVEGLTVFI